MAVGCRRFSSLGVRLLTAGRLDYATQSVYKVRVRVTDQGGLWFEKAMVLVLPMDEGEAGRDGTLKTAD